MVSHLFGQISSIQPYLISMQISGTGSHLLDELDIWPAGYPTKTISSEFVAEILVMLPTWSKLYLLFVGV
jgi:hypothetical protein